MQTRIEAKMYWRGGRWMVELIRKRPQFTGGVVSKLMAPAENIFGPWGPWPEAFTSKFLEKRIQERMFKVEKKPDPVENGIYWIESNPNFLNGPRLARWAGDHWRTVATTIQGNDDRLSLLNGVTTWQGPLIVKPPDWVKMKTEDTLLKLEEKRRLRWKTWKNGQTVALAEPLTMKLCNGAVRKFPRGCIGTIHSMGVKNGNVTVRFIGSRPLRLPAVMLRKSKRWPAMGPQMKETFPNRSKKKR